MQELKIAVKKTNEFLKKNGIASDMPIKEGKKNWNQELQIPACQLNWEYKLNGQMRTKSALVPMRVFEIPAVFGEGCDEECAHAFVDCLMNDARKQ